MGLRPVFGVNRSGCLHAPARPLARCALGTIFLCKAIRESTGSTFALFFREFFAEANELPKKRPINARKLGNGRPHSPENKDLVTEM
jgi:hypothetical protein